MDCFLFLFLLAPLHFPFFCRIFYLVYIFSVKPLLLKPLLYFKISRYLLQLPSNRKNSKFAVQLSQQSQQSLSLSLSLPKWFMWKISGFFSFCWAYDALPTSFWSSLVPMVTSWREGCCRRNTGGGRPLTGRNRRRFTGRLISEVWWTSSFDRAVVHPTSEAWTRRRWLATCEADWKGPGETRHEPLAGFYRAEEARAGPAFRCLQFKTWHM